MNGHPGLGYFDEGLDLVEPKLYAAVRKPFGRAQILPPAAYRSKIFADLEDEKIWTRGWVCIGVQQQIPGAGDILPFTVGNHGIHVERLAGGGLIGRFNKAQHGGCRAIPAQCQTGAKTRCSFTSCGYSRDRAVIHAAEVDEDLRLAGQYLGDRPERLLPVNVGCWGPFIFVNLDSECESLADRFKGLGKPTAPYFGAGLKLVSEQQSELGSNWKLAGHGFLENPSLPFAAGGANKPARPARSEKPVHAERLYALADDYAERFSSLPPLAGLAEAERGNARLCWLFPNLLLALMPDSVMAIILQPLATASTMQRTALLADQNVAPDFEELDCLWEEALAGAADAAEARQLELEAWGSPLKPGSSARRLPREDSAHGYDFQKYLVACILAEHEIYWSAPLYSQPRR
jgi:hypothetical protein